MITNSLTLTFTFTFFSLISIWALVLISGSSTGKVFAQTTTRTVAVVNGRNITQTEIDSLIPSQYLILEPQQLYALRKVALDNFIIKVLLEEAAKRKKIPVEKLRKQMTVGKVKIPNSKVEQEYMQNAFHFASMSPDEAKERIRLDLESEARIRLYLDALSKLKIKANIKSHLEEPQLSLKNLSNRESPSKGSKGARVTIVEFSDFRCGYCRESQEVLKKVMIDYKENVRLIYKHLPLQTTPQAIAPAIAAYCAEFQGRFWEFHDNLFASDDLSLNSIKKIVEKINMDLPKFESCFTSDTSRLAVLDDLREGMRLGISSTPTFIINGKIYSGKIGFAEFKNIIERELASAQQNTKK